MTILVQYLADRDVLAVSTIRIPFPPRALQAKRQTVDGRDLLAVVSPVTGEPVCDWLPATEWARPDGSMFATADEAFAYLSATCDRAPSKAPLVSATVAQQAEGLPKGMPVALSRATGQMQPARADTYALAFVAGLSETDLAAGLPATAVRTSIDRDDWTLVAGTQNLALGQPYFLGLTGGITLTPDRTPGNCLVRVGVPASPTRLAFVAADPILL